jgi:CRP-like cAMP-binding protein
MTGPGADAVSVLRRVPLFARLAPHELSALSVVLVLRKYRAGQVIFHQGDAGSSLHIIQSGRVKISLVSEDGAELIVALLQEGDFFGELALLDGHPRSATAIAVTDAQTRAFGREEFLNFVRKFPDAAVAVCAALAQRLRQADERLAETVFLDLPHRLARRVAELADRYGRRTAEGVVLDMPFTQSDLAELAGATRQSVNKVLSQWEQEGVLRRERRSILILRPEKLRNGLVR